MKVITDCSVHVVGAPQFFDHPVYKIPDGGTDSERIGAFGAKGCYDAYGEDGRGVIENQRAILEHSHGSILEHSHVTIFMEGITRALTLELNRHRPFNISQRSTRYTKEEDAAIVLDPYYASIWDKYGMSINEKTQWIRSTEFDDLCCSDTPLDLQLVYGHVAQSRDDLLRYAKEVGILEKLNPNNLTGFALRKWARGKARNKTPHSLETRGIWTNNFRGWRWFIEARSSRHAEPEIRRLADAVFGVLEPWAPTYFEDFEMVEVVDGIREWVPKHSKV